MIVVVEGPSAAGKTTWIAMHHGGATVISEARPELSPDRSNDPAAAASHWANVNSARWAAAREAEEKIGVAICDTDPFKLYYAWCLWQSGNATAGQWRAEMSVHRELFADHRLGIADLILVSIPDPATLVTRRQADTSRRRRNFDLHAQLADPLRAWYRAVGALDPDRVRWELPSSGIPGRNALQPRNPRTGAVIFDALMEQLPAR